MGAINGILMGVYAVVRDSEDPDHHKADQAITIPSVLNCQSLSFVNTRW